jgi:hypothetical protein
MNEDVLAKGVQLREWMKQDRDIQRIVLASCSANGVASFAELAAEHPEAFAEVFDVCQSMWSEDEGR